MTVPDWVSFDWIFRIDWYLSAYAVLATVFVLCLLVQLVFLFNWYARVAGHKYSSTATNLKQPPVSVIVSVHFNLDKARPLIDALLAQDYPKFEIVIVDDRNDEESFLALLDLRDREDRIRLTRIEYTPARVNAKKYALTLGIKAAQYDHVLLTDADCLPTGNQWLGGMMARFDRGIELVLGFSPYEKRPGMVNTLIRYETLRTGLQYLGGALAGRPYMGVGRNLGYTRQLFFAYKGFYKHISLNGGDDDLFVNRTARRHNVRLCLDPQTFMTSIPKETFGEWYEQKQRHYHVSRYYKAGDKRRLGLLSGSYVFFYLLLLPLLFFPWGYALAGGGWLLRALVHTPVVATAGKKLEQRFPVLLVPFIDLVYVWVFAWFSFRAVSRRSWRGW